jgi:uncharacterized protein (TIGR02246 family)
MGWRTWLLGLVVGVNALWAIEETDRQAIEGIVAGYTQSWNQRKGHGFGDGFAEDADFVNIFGMHFAGRSEIERRHMQILETIFKGSQLEITSCTLREAQPGVVIALVRWKLASSSSTVKQGIFTQLFLQSDGQWQIAASQNTLIP